MNTFEPIQFTLVFMPKKEGKRQFIDYDEFDKIANQQLDVLEKYIYTKESPCGLVLYPSNDYSVAIIRNNDYTKMQLISKNSGDWCNDYLRKLTVRRQYNPFQLNRILSLINREQR